MSKYSKYLDEIRELGGSNRNIDDKVLIIDGLNFFIRAFGAVPTLNDDGEHIGGISGFLMSIGSLVKQFRPTRVLIVFDGKGGSLRRRKIYPDYKAGRRGLSKLNRATGFEDLEDADKSMKHQFSRVLKYVNTLPVQTIQLDYVEADDVIAYAATTVFEKSVIICSSDKDFLQLVNDRVHVYTPTKKKLITPDDVLEEYGIPSHNLIYYRMITGDVSDNIKGVNRVGKKTIVNKMDFLKGSPLEYDDLINHINTLDDKLKSRILDQIDILERNYKLMQLSESSVSANATSNIRSILRTANLQFDIAEFKRLFIADKMYTAFNDVDAWLRSVWSYITKIKNV